MGILGVYRGFQWASSGFYLGGLDTGGTRVSFYGFYKVSVRASEKVLRGFRKGFFRSSPGSMVHKRSCLQGFDEAIRSVFCWLFFQDIIRVLHGFYKALVVELPII